MPVEKKAVCFIIPTTDAGGTENYALRLLRYLKDEYDIIIWSVGRRPGSLHTIFQQEAKHLLHIPVSYKQPGALFTYLRVLRHYRIKTVLNFNGDFAGLSLLAAFLLNIEKRIVFYRRSTRAFSQTFFKRVYNSFVHTLVKRFATAILSNSNTALSNFFGENYRKDSRCRIIPNGIDASLLSTDLSKTEARAALKIDFDGFLVGHVGRIDPAKNHTAMLEVAEQLKSHAASINFLFCGKDTDGDQFRAEIEKRGLTKQVWLMGLQKEMAVVYRALDVFLFPSVTEGQPNALIEAMISGLPILASNIDPIKEVLPEEMHDTLISPNDVKQMIARLHQLQVDNNKTTLEERKQWASKKYGHLSNFTLVKNEL